MYQPPDWLICTVNRISPYVPQIGDEVRVKAEPLLIISHISPKPAVQIEKETPTFVRKSVFSHLYASNVALCAVFVTLLRLLGLALPCKIARIALRTGHQANRPVVRMILSSWVDHQEERFSHIIRSSFQTSENQVCENQLPRYVQD